MVTDRNGKATIEYETEEGKKKYGTIAKFYKDVTDQNLQEKGVSWSNICFVDSAASNMGPPFDPKYVKTLEDIKYIIKGPKKAISAFLYFCNEQRATVEFASSSDFSRQVGDMWKSLTDDMKQKYRQMEQQDKTRFMKEKQAWEAINGNAQTSDEEEADISSTLEGTLVSHMDDLNHSLDHALTHGMEHSIGGPIVTLGNTSDGSDSSPVQLSSASVVDALVISGSEAEQYRDSSPHSLHNADIGHLMQDLSQDDTDSL